jgi:HAD superfamily hydrolase (TIGR01549 family)
MGLGLAISLHPQGRVNHSLAQALTGNLSNITVNTMKRLVLFDLDGVLLDSEDNMRRAWQVVQERAGISQPFEEYFSKIGRPFQDILAMMGICHETHRIEQIYMAASFDFLGDAVFFSGTEETLQALAQAGMKLGVVTSKDEPRTRAVLRQLQIHFDTIQCPSGTFRGKPAPDHLMLAMAEARTDPADTIYIGDMETDHEAARRAGIDYLHAAWGYGGCLEGGRSIASIRELLKQVL